MVQGSFRYLMQRTQRSKKIIRMYSRLSKINEFDVSRIRNIGILAHIDAGKTTTTERMLFYAGVIRSLGEVHHGNTVTDFLEQEKLRGISIASASVSFGWKDYIVNLIDTPGHIDFTSEVERTLNVMDSAIVLLDGSSGVEAQTLTVWRQADHYSLPRMIYVNKMDRHDADPRLCIESISKKLETEPLVIQWPIVKNKMFCGLVDLLTMKALCWDGGTRGKTYHVSSLEEVCDPLLQDESFKARSKLIDQLADVDDTLAKEIIKEENFDISVESLCEALKRATVTKAGVPLLWGSSYKNIGVQPLLDAVVKYLPAPDLRVQQLLHGFGSNLCARAYKIWHDHQKKPVTYFRVYTGKMFAGQRLYNIQREKADHVKKLFVPFADEPKEVAEMGPGNIVAVTGLQYTASGDFVTTNASAAHNAIQKLSSYECSPGEDIFRSSAKVPVPVFFCSVEPPSQAYQSKMEGALLELQKEDPSFFVTNNVETGQTVLAGMGELHLEIIKNRIVSEYNIEVELGPVQVAYCETMLSRVQDSFTVSQKIGRVHHQAAITLSVFGTESSEVELPLLDTSPEYAPYIAAINPRQLAAVKLGIESALTYGPRIHSKVINVAVMLHKLEISKGTSGTIITAAASQCVHKILESSGTQIMEPVMVVEVIARVEDLSAVLADLSRRRSVLNSITDRGQNKIIEAVIPMQELLGYSTDLRTITSGTASFTMQFHEYQMMSGDEEQKAIKRLMGF